MLSERVHTFGQFLLKKHGERVHKIALDAGFTCPNRDGAKGIGGFVHELFTAPFGKWMFPANLLLNAVELLAKPVSLAMRLFGNMYGGEIVFLLIWVLGGAGVGGALASAVFGLGWGLFHILIITLQAFIFMMLTLIYLGQAHEAH